MKWKENNMTIEQFSDLIGVDLIITYYANQENRFCCHFKDTAIKEKGLLRYTHGNGNSYKMAVDDYIERIRGETIVTNAYSGDRKEFNVPKYLGI
jgi:hypothetical protein